MKKFLSFFLRSFVLSRFVYAKLNLEKAGVFDNQPGLVRLFLNIFMSKGI